VAGLPFVPFVLFERLTRVLPGSVVTFGIEKMVGLISVLGIGPTDVVAKMAEQALAVASMFLLAIVAGAVLAVVARHRPRAAVIVGALFGIALAALTLAVAPIATISSAVTAAIWLWFVLGGWGALLGLAMRKDSDAEGEPVESRRRFLKLLAAASLALFAIASGLGRAIGGRERRAREPGLGGSGAAANELPSTSGPAASPPADVLDARFPAAPGTRPELTATADFYRIDINLQPPMLDPQSWRLQVDGMVSDARPWTLDELRALPSVSQAVTLECISNRLGGDLISTAIFTGVPLAELLRRAGRRPEARNVFLESADGYFETVEAGDVEDPRTLLVWAMNGEPLPVEHGFPLRIYIPNRFGMKQPKWITHLEATDQLRPGYWVERGWSREAIVPTTSVIDKVATSMMLGQTKVLPVGGIAYSGARGISRVEVQVDDGPWVEARLRVPPLSPLSWVQWRYDWPYQPGRHAFRVRAYDGRGTLQPTEMRGPHPDGATGIFEMETAV
jgi:DMSO/TMAO reductase YedYZ molybdopterin-dependent catalytic subunit